jgi:hypothetical protein
MPENADFTGLARVLTAQFCGFFSGWFCQLRL